MFGFSRAKGPKVPVMSAQEVAATLEGGTPPVIIDVRTAQEFSGEGRIAASRLLPLQSLPQRLHEVPTDQPVVLVCRSGARSHAACEMLAARGYSNVHNLSGGVIAWQRAGLPLVR